MASELGRHCESYLAAAGTIGQVRHGRLHFVAEMRSLTHVLGQTVGRAFQASCDAAPGIARIKPNDSHTFVVNNDQLNRN